jgi:hypothetical protein
LALPYQISRIIGKSGIKTADCVTVVEKTAANNKCKWRIEENCLPQIISR